MIADLCILAGMQNVLSPLRFPHALDHHCREHHLIDQLLRGADREPADGRTRGTAHIKARLLRYAHNFDTELLRCLVRIARLGHVKPCTGSIVKKVSPRAAGVIRRRVTQLLILASRLRF